VREIGDLRVWHIPQVPGKPFTADVDSVEDGVKFMLLLSGYDLFQFENNIKPDYCNAQGLCRWCEDAGDGVPGWEDWYDEETGEDDPLVYLKGEPHDQTI
jgi:hypothetical protein